MDKIKEIVYDKRLEILKEHFSIDKKLLEEDNNLYRILPLKLLIPYIEDNDEIFYFLSSNPSITIDFIESTTHRLHSGWDWQLLTYNSNITEDFIRKYINKNWKPEIQGISAQHPRSGWDWKYLSIYKPLSFLESFKNKINWNYLSKNPNLTCEYIEANLDKRWDWDSLSSNDIITCEFIEKYIDKEWNWNLLSCNDKITCKFIEKYIDKPWNWYLLGSNKNITIDFVKKYENKLSWFMLSLGLNVNLEILELYKNKFDWDNLSRNDSINLDILESYIDCNWSWYALSYKTYLTSEFLDKHINKDWNYHALSCNPSIQLDFIIKHIDKPWNWDNISRRKNITLDDFLKNKHLKWTYNLFLNKSILNINIYDSDYIKEVNKYMAIQKIKRITREAICNPKYALARKKIKDMFEEIIDGL